MDTQTLQTLYLIVPFAPLFGAILAGLFGKFLGRTWTHRLTVAMVGVSLFAAIQVFRSVLDGHTFDGAVYT
ncbi:MAG: NADH-quinone oxidoreductase subunit L, partial [Gallionella sp.]